MSERIKELAELAWTIVSNEERARGELYEADKQRERRDQVFAELLLKECADIADEMEEIMCPYPGDAMVERFGFGTEEGAATWRTK